VVDQVGLRNTRDGDGTPGSFGVVVGATVADPPRLDALSGPVLMPGVGEQGGTLADVRRIAGPALGDTLVNVSRHVLRARPAGGARVPYNLEPSKRRSDGVPLWDPVWYTAGRPRTVAEVIRPGAAEVPSGAAEPPGYGEHEGAPAPGGVPQPADAPGTVTAHQ